MPRRHALLVAGLAVSLTLVLPPPASPAVVATVVPATGQVIEGWTGDTPATVGVGVDQDNGVTAAFTSTSGDRTDLWVADRSPGGVWAGAVRIAEDVNPGTADFAETASGAAVLAWDAQDTNGGTALRMSIRGAAPAAWSPPSTVVTDAGLSHRVSVGIGRAGAATVAYAHDPGTGVGVHTQRYAAGAWEPAVEHAVAPVRQIQLAVGGNGYATLAWTQDEASEVNLHVRRFLASTWEWEPARLEATGIAPQGLLDLAVNDNATSALDYFYPASDGRGGYEVRMAYGYLWPAGPCAADCNQWRAPTVFRNHDSRPPSAAVTVNGGGHKMGVYPWDVGDGTSSIHAMETGADDHGPSVEVAPPGDHDHLTAVSDGFRTLATWVTHTAAGDRLFARTVVEPGSGILADPRTSSLGAVSGAAVSALGPNPDGLAVVVWPDTTVQPAVLRSSSAPVFYPYFHGPDEIAAEMVSPTVKFNPSIQVRARWSSPSAGPGPRYDVRIRQANARHPFGGPYRFRTQTTETSAWLQTVRGRTVCFSARGAGAWSGERCTAAAVDDTALAGRYWKRDRYAPWYGLSRLSTTRKGAQLTISAIRARSIALLVSRRRDNGRVQVRLGGENLGTFRLDGPHAHRVVIPVADFGRMRYGTLSITAVDAGKPVNIDGVFISAR